MSIKGKTTNSIRTMSATLSALLIIIVLFASSVGVNAESLKTVGDEAVLKKSFDATVGGDKVDMPELKAKAAVLYSTDLKKTIYSKNADERLSPYSITKLLTCYLAAENLDTDKLVTVSKKAADDLANGTTMYLVEGERVSVKNLIYGSLMISGNDAAYALAEAVSGSEARFVELMNETVEDWGCENTHFTNSNGMKSKNHYTTAADYTIIIQKVMENELVRRVSSESKYEMPATNKSGVRKMKGHMVIRDVIMVNEDTKKKGIGDASGITCGKTGYWEDSDCSVSLMYEKQQLRAVVVILGDSIMGRDKDVQKLFQYAHEVTPGYMATQSGEAISQAWIKGGEFTKFDIAPAKDVYAYPERGKEGNIEIELVMDGKPSAPIEKGDAVGEYVITVDGREVARTAAVSAESIAEGWFPSMLYISNRASIIILVALAIMILLLGIIKRNKRNAKREERSKRNKRDAKRENRSKRNKRDANQRKNSKRCEEYKSKH